MRIGDAVTYADGTGGQPALVTAVVGSGPSGYKLLDLEVAGRAVPGVPHVRDAPQGPCWLLAGDPLPGAPAAESSDANPVVDD